MEVNCTVLDIILREKTASQLLYNIHILVMLVLNGYWYISIELNKIF